MSLRFFDDPLRVARLAGCFSSSEHANVKSLISRFARPEFILHWHRHQISSHVRRITAGCQFQWVCCTRTAAYWASLFAFARVSWVSHIRSSQLPCGYNLLKWCEPSNFVMRVICCSTFSFSELLSMRTFSFCVFQRLSTPRSRSRIRPIFVLFH